MATVRKRKSKKEFDTTIPRFTIDLSLEPEDRYVALADHYRSEIHRLTSLFDDLLLDLGIPRRFHKSINRVAQLLLRRVHSSVETAELHGISRTANIPMYLLVSLNLVLDLLMGCTSGAVKSRELDQKSEDAHMLHFRTLDWAMDPLRSVIVQLDYVQSHGRSGTQVLGSSITYVGFVGILTGVRKGLSLSLNFRAVHDASTKSQQFRFYLHHILVLLGLRQSISGLLRSCLFGDDKTWVEKPNSLEMMTETITCKHTTAAYLISCDGKNSVSIEKDFDTALIHESQQFLVTTNHDLKPHVGHLDKSVSSRANAMQDLLDESEDRRNCIVGKWKAKIRDEQRARESALQRLARGHRVDGMRTRSMRCGRLSLDSDEDQGTTEPAHTVARGCQPTLSSVEETVTVTRQELIRWTTSFPTTNECTHFAAILDPSMGQVLWSQMYLQPREHPSDEEPRAELDRHLERD